MPQQKIVALLLADSSKSTGSIAGYPPTVITLASTQNLPKRQLTCTLPKSTRGSLQKWNGVSTSANYHILCEFT